VFLLLHCGDFVDHHGGDGGGGAGGTAGDGGEPPEIASLFGWVFEFDPPPIEVPVKGVRVCQLDTDKCSVSDSHGFVEIQVQRNHEEIAFTVEKEGYGSWVYPNVTDERFPEAGFDPSNPARFPMYRHETLAEIAEQIGTPYPWEGGIVGLVRWVSPTKGVRFIAVGPTADEVGPSFYFDASTQQYSVELEATTVQWGLPDFPLGEGGFAGVSPGVQQFEMAGAAGICDHASWAWPGDAPNRIRVPVLEGYQTYGSMRCEP
jgi:hypothetical protein